MKLNRKSFAKQRGFLLNPFRFSSGSSEDLVQDIGDSGWTDPRTFAVEPTGAISTWFDNTQVGSRVHYIDGENGTDPATVELCKDQVYFIQAGVLVDRNGNTAPTSGPHSGVPYGDPLLPSVAVSAFKTWACVAPKTITTESLRASGVWIARNDTGISNAWRQDKPDWYLFKRGVRYSMYDGLRTYMDATGESASSVSTKQTHSLRTLGGPSAANPTVVGAYGPLSDGRAEIVHPTHAFMYSAGTHRHQFNFGFLCNGRDRQRRIRPVDWAHFATQDTKYDGPQYNGLSSTSFGHRFEDVHFAGCSTEFNGGSVYSHTTLNSTWDVDFWRCLFEAAFSEGHTATVTSSRTSGDGNQTVSANTEATVVFPTETIDTNTAYNAATGVMTMAVSGFSWSFWPLMDVQATIAGGGTLRVSLFKNGTEVDFYTLPGTGVTNDTYYCVRDLRPTMAFQSSGATYEIRINTTGATGNVLVLGGNARFVASRLATPTSLGTSGFHWVTWAGSSFRRRQCVLLLNGFRCDPRTQPALKPAAATPWFAWNFLDHDDYTQGENLPNQCELSDNVLMLGASGAVYRQLTSHTRNFYYQQYISITPGFDRVTTTSQANLFNDNVYLRFAGLADDPNVAGAPGYGVLIGCGHASPSVQRNIISDYCGAGRTSTDGWGIRLAGQISPYGPLYAEGHVYWQDTTSATVTGNYVDSIAAHSGSLFAAPVQELNGGSLIYLGWQVRITGFDRNAADPTGTVVTANLTAGYTGTPVYEWRRYDAVNDLNPAYTVVGGTGTTHTLTADDWATQPVTGRKILRTVCVVSNITYPAGVGIGASTITGNYSVKPSARPFFEYFNMDSQGGPYGTDIYSYAPATSNATESGNTAYTTTTAAESALGLPSGGWERNIKTFLQSIGHTVSSSDGLDEYVATVAGSLADPKTEAFRRGRWDSRYLLGMMNHVRVGRGLAALV